MLRIAIIGYGKMGKAVEAEAIARGHEIVAKIDVENAAEKHALQLNEVDVAIEFTHPAFVMENMESLMQKGIPMVTGTTGWHQHIGKVKAMVEAHGGSLLYSSNFSVGVNILFKLNEYLAKLMNNLADYDCFVEERHHRYKEDGPSGTAHSLASQIIQHLDRKSQIATEELSSRKPESDELSVGFIRAGEIKGEHRVTYTSEIDSISLSHTAYSRRGFALGAVIAAEWLATQQGFFNFADIFENE